MREIDESARIVLHLDAQLADLGRQLADLVQHVDVGRTARHPAAELRRRCGRTGLILEHVDMCVEPLYLHELRPHDGNERISFFYRKELHRSSCSVGTTPPGTN